MKILPIYQCNFYNKIQLKNSSTQIINENSDYNNLELPNYQVAFGANVSNRLNIKNAQKKLIELFSDILKNDLSDVSDEDLMLRAMRKISAFYSDKLKKIYELYAETELFTKNQMNFNQSQFVSTRNSILKRVKALQNSKPPKDAYTFKIPEEKYDFELINKFKTAIEDENFDLIKVFKDYYSDLNNVKTLEELKERYPKLPIPARPQEIMAKKIESTFTKDFYIKMHNLIENRDNDGAYELLKNTVEQIIAPIPDSKFTMSKEEVVKDLLNETADIFHEKYSHIKKNNFFASLPEHKRIKQPLFSDNDLRLFSIDYDTYVIEVLRQQYLEFKNPNEIILDIIDGTQIKVCSIKDSEYKFEKIPAKIKMFLSEGQKLKSAQRDYNNMNTEELKERLEFFSDRLGNNEKLLDKIIEFGTCRFTNEDKQLLKDFLQELDNVQDGRQTIEQALKNIKNKDLKPKGTEKLNEIEHQNAIEQMKLSQKLHSELRNKQTNFDNAINILYEHNMPSLADICSKYRPKSLDEGDAEAQYIINVINRNISGKNFESSKAEREIIRWDKYLQSKNNELKKEIVEKAELYSINSVGKIEPQIAGNYILNSEIAEFYPDSLKFYSNPDLLSKIMDYSGQDKEFATKYLCKLSEFTDLSNQEKTHILKFINKFDIKDTLDKSVLREILEKDYILSDTKDFVNISGNKGPEVTITSKAKEQIYDYYKFPACVEYFADFEDAMTQLAGKRGTSGIKPLGTNNYTMSNVLELKIMGHDDRLFAYNGTYYFDEFSHKGMH